MDSSISNRVKMISEKFFRGNTSEMARNVFIRQATLRDIIAEKVNPSYDTILQIVENTTLNINPEWLLTGKGEMLKDAQPQQSTEFQSLNQEIETLKNMIREQSTLLISIQNQLNTLKK